MVFFYMMDIQLCTSLDCQLRVSDRFRLVYLKIDTSDATELIEKHTIIYQKQQLNSYLSPCKSNN